MKFAILTFKILTSIKLKAPRVISLLQPHCPFKDLAEAFLRPFQASMIEKKAIFAKMIYHRPLTGS